MIDSLGDSRLSALAAGDLTKTQIGQFIGGNLELLKGLPQTTLRGITPLVAATSSSVRGELEKLVGPTEDFLPVAYLDLSPLHDEQPRD